MLTLTITSPSAIKTISLPLDPLPLARQFRMASSNTWPFSLDILSTAGTQLNTLKNPHENPHENGNKPKFEGRTCTNY